MYHPVSDRLQPATPYGNTAMDLLLRTVRNTEYGVQIAEYTITWTSFLSSVTTLDHVTRDYHLSQNSRLG